MEGDGSSITRTENRQRSFSLKPAAVVGSDDQKRRVCNKRGDVQKSDALFLVQAMLIKPPGRMTYILSVNFWFVRDYWVLPFNFCFVMSTHGKCQCRKNRPQVGTSISAEGQPYLERKIELVQISSTPCLDAITNKNHQTVPK